MLDGSSPVSEGYLRNAGLAVTVVDAGTTTASASATSTTAATATAAAALLGLWVESACAIECGCSSTYHRIPCCGSCRHRRHDPGKLLSVSRVPCRVALMPRICARRAKWDVDVPLSLALAVCLGRALPTRSTGALESGPSRLPALATGLSMAFVGGSAGLLGSSSGSLPAGS
jgi:hypothetical protein